MSSVESLSGSTVLTTMSLSNGRAAAGHALAPGFMIALPGIVNLAFEKE